MNSGPYVYLSFCRDDAALALPLAQYFRGQGLRLFLCRGESPDAEEIGRSGAFLALVTPAYLASHACRSEFNSALMQKIQMLCVLAGDPPLTVAMQMHLGAMQSFTAMPGEAPGQLGARVLGCGALAGCMGGKPLFALVREADGARFCVDRDGLLIGRNGEKCDIVLTDDSVSRVHARITLEGEIIGLTDLRSMNGVRINGVLLEADEMCEIEPDDEIDIGNVRLILEQN